MLWVICYTYDANNRLILRSHDADGYYGTIGDTTRTLYIHDMGQIVLELEETGSWTDFGAEDLTHHCTSHFS